MGKSGPAAGGRLTLRGRCLKILLHQFYRPMVCVSMMMTNKRAKSNCNHILASRAERNALTPQSCAASPSLSFLSDVEALAQVIDVWLQRLQARATCVALHG